MIRQQVKDEYREHRKLLRNIKRVKSINKIKIKDMKTNINIFDEPSKSKSIVLPSIRKKKTKKNLSVLDVNYLPPLEKLEIK